MLRVTISLIPNGDETRATELARADIGNVSRGGALSDYRVRVSEEHVTTGKLASIKGYPRWSASVLDLVLRCLAKAQYGEEQIPPRPAPLNVPIYEADGFSFVRIEDIPQPARSVFLERMRFSTGPVVPGQGECVYSWDWLAFQAGG